MRGAGQGVQSLLSRRPLDLLFCEAPADTSKGDQKASLSLHRPLEACRKDTLLVTLPACTAGASMLPSLDQFESPQSHDTLGGTNSLFSGVSTAETFSAETFLRVERLHSECKLGALKGLRQG